MILIVVHYPHDDALVVSMIIADYEVGRVLIDGGSFDDALFWDAYEKIN